MTQDLSPSTFASSKHFCLEPEDPFAKDIASINAFRNSSQQLQLYAPPQQQNKIVIGQYEQALFTDKIFKTSPSFWGIESGLDIDRRTEENLQNCSTVKVEILASPRAPLRMSLERSLHKIARQAHSISSANFRTFPSHHRNSAVHDPQTLCLPYRRNAMTTFQVPSIEFAAAKAQPFTIRLSTHHQMELRSMSEQNLRELRAIKVEMILSPNRELFSGFDQDFTTRMAAKFFRKAPLSSTLQRDSSHLCTMEEVRRLTSGYNPKIFISATNGINTTEAEAASHQLYVQKLAGQKVNWVYNRSHGAILDLMEVFTMNYLGLSPNTAKELRGKWSAFHERNLGNPNEKLLHYCHSQGAIHTFNALRCCPSEVRDRVIVVAIAPAKIIPREMCHQSFNYASKKDIVHYGELTTAGFFDSSETGSSKYMEIMLNNREQLILLDPHPDAKNIDHGFQSPTFRDVIERRLKKYLQRGNR